MKPPGRAAERQLDARRARRWRKKRPFDLDAGRSFAVTPRRLVGMSGQRPRRQARRQSRAFEIRARRELRVEFELQLFDR